MRRQAGVALTICAGAVVGAGAVFAARVPTSPGPLPTEPVLVGGASEEGPVGAQASLMWMESETPNLSPPRSRTNVVLRRPHGRPLRINPPGTYAQTGGLLDRDTLVVQLVRGGRSDIATIDLAPRRVRYLGSSINTPDWEWRPSVSGDWLLFGRILYETNAYETLLANLRTGKVTRLDIVSGHAAYAAPGQVNGNFAVWISCPDNFCRVYRYDIRRRRTLMMPLVGGGQNWQFGPSVARSGATYFGVARYCDGARLVRYVRGRVTTLLHLPRDHAFQYSYVDETNGTPRILFDQVGCARSSLSDIYALDDKRP